MKKIRITLFSAMAGILTNVGFALRNFTALYPDLIELQARCGEDISDSLSTKEFLTQYVEKSDCLIVILHGGKESCACFDDLINASSNAYRFIYPSSEDDREVSMQYSTLFGDSLYTDLLQYINYGGPANWENLFKRLGDHFNRFFIPFNPPEKALNQGLYHPETGPVKTLADYVQLRGESLKTLREKNCPVIGLWFYQGNVIEGNLEAIDQVIFEIEKQGGFPVPCFFLRHPDKLKQNKDPIWITENFFQVKGNTIIHVLINFMVFSISLSTPRYSETYKKLGVTVLQAIPLFNSYRFWNESEQGVTPMDVCISAAQPEFDGVLVTVPFCTKEVPDRDPLTGASLIKQIPIKERVAKLVQIACKWSCLKLKSNQQKKVAILFHSYPPRNDRIGCAAGLDSFASVVGLLHRLKAEGYCLETTYDNGDELAQEMLQRAVIDRRWLTPDKMAKRATAHISKDEYSNWYQLIPAENRKQLRKKWGDSPGEPFVHNEKISVNGLINGNIYIGIQAPRGYLEKPENLHDPHLPPGYHYLYHYRWIRDSFKADAVIHVGKHGSLEWLPGKSMALSKECWPDLALADLPNIYPYIINDPGEGTQAKRRSSACIVDHLIPVMTNAELYEDLEKINAELQEYTQVKSMNPQRIDRSRKEIWKAVEAANLHTDLDINSEIVFENFEKFLEKLHAYLGEIADTAINNGLHTLGVPPENDDLVELVTQFLRLKNGEVPSLRQVIAESWGLDYDALCDNRGKAESTGQFLTNSHAIAAIHEKSLEIVRLIVSGRTPDNVDVASFDKVVSFIAETVLPKILQTTEELDSTVDALSGHHVLPGGSGTPTRGKVDILPSGRNFFSVDPFKIPTRQAWLTGITLGDILIEKHHHDTSRYPEAIGIVIWGCPTMRTSGEDIAEALYLMGTKPVWNENTNRIQGIEVIPTDQLKFPRVDVTFRTSGFFRDSFPNLIELLDEAVTMVCSLSEPLETNFLRKNMLLEKQELIKSGMPHDKAERHACFRVYSDAPGTYGTGVPETIDAKEWENVEDLGHTFTNWGGYAYGKGVYGLKDRGGFQQRLSKIDVVIKNEDSREYDLLSSDDFNAYFGGFIAAVKTASGQYPYAYAGDASDPGHLKYRNLDKETKHIFRSRILNPKWIEGMMRHGYKGAGDLSRAVDISFHWDATSNVIDDWMYEGLAQKYALDPKMKKWFKKENPFALQNISERLIEAIQRKMWDASDQMMEELEAIFLDMEGNIEDISE